MSEPVQKMIKQATYQFNILLEDVQPPIWRRLQVDNYMPLNDFHVVLQLLMGWQNYHLHAFRTEDACWGPIFEEDPLDMFDEREQFICKLFPEVNSSVLYEYDFGDGWEHIITLEEIHPFDTKKKYPVCIEGEGACPPEDCGGPWGYMNLLDALDDPDHDEHDELTEWIGGEFDSEYFDLKAINRELKQYRKWVNLAEGK